MNVGLDSVGRRVTPSFAAGAAGVSLSTRTAGGWKAREIGTEELSRVSGEQAVDERELARDDSLGCLVARAFDPAGVTLPKLFE